MCTAFCEMFCCFLVRFRDSCKAETHASEQNNPLEIDLPALPRPYRPPNSASTDSQQSRKPHPRQGQTTTRALRSRPLPIHISAPVLHEQPEPVKLPSQPSKPAKSHRQPNPPHFTHSQVSSAPRRVSPTQPPPTSDLTPAPLRPRIHPTTAELHARILRARFEAETHRGTSAHSSSRSEPSNIRDPSRKHRDPRSRSEPARRDHGRKEAVAALGIPAPLRMPLRITTRDSPTKIEPTSQTETISGRGGVRSTQEEVGNAFLFSGRGWERVL